MSEESSRLSETPSATATTGHAAGRDRTWTALVPSLGRSWELCRVDLLRGYRWVRRQDFWLVFTAVVGLMSAFFLWQTALASRALGAALTGGAPLPAWPVLGAAVSWLLLTVLLALDALGSNGGLDNDGQYLTVRPAADLVGGKLLAAAAKFSVYTVGLGLAAGAGLVVGTGSVFPAVGVAAAAIAIPATATAVGYPVGLALKGFIRRSENLGRLTTLLGAGLGLGYVTLSVTGELLAAVELLAPVLQAPPLAWFGHLALATTPQAGVGTGTALAALGIAPAVVALGTALSVPAARYAWLADGAHADGGAGTGLPAAPASRLDGALGAVCRAAPTRGIAATTLRRAARAPFQFVFVAPPLLAAILFVESAVTTGSVPWYVPWFTVWYGAWAAGAVLPLNPLGNQGSALPSLLTAPARGRHVVHGTVVAATAVGAPLTAAAAVGAGFLADSSPVVLASLAAVSVSAVASSAVLATGLGTLFPRFDAVRLGGSRRAVPPSKRAYSLFSFALSLLVLAVALVVDGTARTVGAVLLSGWLPFGADIGAGTLGVLAGAVVACGIVAVPLAYRGAVRRIEEYNLQ